METTIDERQRVFEGKKRNRLQEEKPLVYNKIIHLSDRLNAGEAVPRIDIAYDYKCNLSCEHCMANHFEVKDRHLTVADLRNIAQQADDLGLCQFNISGGEPLVFPDIDEVIQALWPERFHIGMSTNGHFLTPERARHLKAIGLDKVMISLDDIDPQLHDANRARKGSYEKAISALWAAKEAGLDTIIQHVVTHQNAQSENTVKLAQYAQENGFSLDLIIAKALGKWERRHDVLITPDDAKFLYELHQKYPVARRDVFPSYGAKRGCGAVNSCVHISKYGDFFPCVFMHISIGNVLDEPLKDIIDRGMMIKHFKRYSPICLSGENRHFIDKYMSKFYGKNVPVNYKEIFTAEDFIDGKIH